jgi:hypothetical protein
MGSVITEAEANLKESAFLDGSYASICSADGLQASPNGSLS